MTETLLDRIDAAVARALQFNKNAMVGPVALLWPDGDEQFAAAATRLGEQRPVLTLGEWDESGVRGPAIWLRCAIAGTVNTRVSSGVPVVYLPGVAREHLRAIEDCPRHLAPIAELQYRGEWFGHPNGRDWTIRGFLSNDEKGLGLGVAADAETGDALVEAFEKLLDLPMRQLESEFIDSAFLNRLLEPDPEDSLLSWLDDPSGFRKRVDDTQWRAFVELSKQDYGFDPATGGEIEGARHLGMRKAPWSQVWERFVRNPQRYRGVEERLRQARPDEMFPPHPDSWPQDNERAESDLREDLEDLAGAPPGEARSTLADLWEQHRGRRGSVWAQLDQAPLVFALEQLHELGQLTATRPSGDVDALVDAYAQEGWEADAAFLAALASVSSGEDQAAISAAAVALYRPWIEAGAAALQDAIAPLANAGTYDPKGEVSTADSTVTVFVDGLRLDLAHRLAERLADIEIDVDTGLAALPTVTANAKAVLTPVPEGSLAPGENLGPVRASSGAKADVRVLRGLMEERGVQVLHGAEVGDPSGCAWTEIGEIDTRGHEFGAALVRELEYELSRIERRIRSLLDAGWTEVHVVTDHGWVLLPGGLEKVELPAPTTAVKKGRCARLKPGADVSVPTVPWHWDSGVKIAIAPGITCFEAGKEYEHGGVSLQECVVPRLRVGSGAATTATGGPTITKVKWLGLICRIQLEHVGPGATVDIRARAGEPASSVAESVKETTGQGQQSLIVPDEELEGERAFVVVVGGEGEILAQREVTIGSNR